MRKAVTFVILTVALLLIASTVKFDFIGDFGVFVIDATPTEDVNFAGFQVDFLIISPGNVLMGFGVGYHSLNGDLDTFFNRQGVDHSVEIYSVASYRSELSSKFDLFIVSRGGMVLPNHDFSLSGYFVEVSAEIVWFFKWFHVFGGISLKSYAFENSTVTLIPLKIGVGGEY